MLSELNNFISTQNIGVKFQVATRNLLIWLRIKEALEIS